MMMNFSKRAKRYVLRQKGKTLLLGSLLFITVVICLSGVIILRVTDEMIETLAKNSNANVGMFATDFTNSISPNSIDKLQALDNIRDVNKINQLDVTLNDYFYFGPEPMFGVEVRLNGNDDLTLDGPFFIQSKRLLEGSLDLQGNEVLVLDGFAKANDLSIGDMIPFASEDGKVVEGVIAGTYRFSEDSPRNNFVIYGSTALINELQGYDGFVSAHFFVTNPEEINQTKEEMTTLITNPYYDWNVSDSLYRRIRASLDSMNGLVNIMLIVTIVATTVIVSLLLSLWVRERRKETALLLAIGEQKKSITLQRLFEIFSIFLIAFFLAIITMVFGIQRVGDMIYRIQEIEGEVFMENLEFYLTLTDMLISLGIGALTLLFSITISQIPLMKSTPKSILSTID